jgi:hypothetical protein
MHFCTIMFCVPLFYTAVKVTEIIVLVTDLPKVFFTARPECANVENDE